MNKAEKIIIGIIVVAIIGVIIYFAVNNGPKFVGYRTKSKGLSENVFIEDYKTFQKTLSTYGIEESITNLNDFSKAKLSEIFNEEYFETKKVAIVATYEDTSRAYAFSIDDLKYDKTKTSAVVYYTDNPGEYLGTLKDSWYNIMLVEIDNTVTSVSFEKTPEKK